MNIFIELPTWLGDSVMASCAIENLRLNYPNAKITFFGSFVSCELYKSHPNCFKVIMDESKKSKNRLIYLMRKAKELNKFDIALSFRSSFITKVFFKFLKADKKAVFPKTKQELHQVLKYKNFVQTSLNLNLDYSDLKLYFTPNKFSRPVFGLNPGANYGSAKRWYPQYFAQVAAKLSDKFDIIIFGSKNEYEICKNIEEILQKKHVNYKNLCGKTSLKELVQHIAGLTLFITNDSGPMHIAAAFKIPTIALFGPTKFKETCPWRNENARILHLNLKCMPCMKRTCPLKTHECMKNLTPKIVFENLKNDAMFEKIIK